MLVPLPLNDDELSAWLRLSTARGLAPAALRILLGAFGLPQNLLAQPFAALATVAGDAAARAALAPPPVDFAGRLDALRAWRAQPGHAVVPLGDPAYPPRLLTMPDPPPLLYIKGGLDRLHARGVAIVGSRSATPQGIEDAAWFAQALSDAGVAVISGLALGVDAAAHRGALHGAGGTVAVIGTGADLVYPAVHGALEAQIARDGAIVSEWPLGTPARSAHFPQRNRLIAALAEAVLVVEAAMRSGSLITARLANEMGRDVFALPGSIHAPLARGCHRLIKQGAMLIEAPGDVLDELGIAHASSSCTAADTPPATPRALRQATAGTRRKAPATPREEAETSSTPRRAAPAGPFATPAPAAERSAWIDPGPEALRVLDALGHAPATLEILAQRTDIAEAALQAALLQLELAGRLVTLPGGRFVRAVHRQDATVLHSRQMHDAMQERKE